MKRRISIFAAANLLLAIPAMADDNVIDAMTNPHPPTSAEELSTFPALPLCKDVTDGLSLSDDLQQIYKDFAAIAAFIVEKYKPGQDIYVAMTTVGGRDITCKMHAGESLTKDPLPASDKNGSGAEKHFEELEKIFKPALRTKVMIAHWHDLRSPAPVAG